MDDNFPIDIHYNKLLGTNTKYVVLTCAGIAMSSCSDWLVSRRHCDSKWHIQSKALRSRVAIATKDLPRDNAKLVPILQNKDSMCAVGVVYLALTYTMLV